VSDLATKRPPAPPGLDLVEGFINTADLETGSDELATTSALRGWLLGRHLIKRGEAVSERDREQAIRLREALRRAMLANNSAVVDSRTIRELNQLAHDARMVVAFGDDGTPRLDPFVNGVQAGLARILSAVFVAMLTGGWTRLKSCANNDCRWAFYDASKNRSGKWCEMANCGNEAKGRAYRARRRSEVAARSGSK
jgi:predicted RNA-binding Zn ribbon-like protein